MRSYKAIQRQKDTQIIIDTIQKLKKDENWSEISYILDFFDEKAFKNDFFVGIILILTTKNIKQVKISYNALISRLEQLFLDKFGNLIYFKELTDIEKG